MKSLYMFLFVWPLVFSCELATKWRDLNNNKIKDPYENTDLSFEDRAANLVNKMTLDEKISQMQREAPAIERLGITKYSWGNEGLHGVVMDERRGLYHHCISSKYRTASTWNPELVRQEAEVISDEARALVTSLIILNF